VRRSRRFNDYAVVEGHDLRLERRRRRHWRPRRQIMRYQGGIVFAAAGTWIRDDAMRSRQSQALPDLVNGVRQNPGFIRGFWANDLDEPEGRVTFIADDTIDQARAFRDAVVANAAMQTRLGMGRSELHILEVHADA
jgi:hypothetical protein